MAQFFARRAAKSIYLARNQMGFRRFNGGIAKIFVSCRRVFPATLTLDFLRFKQ